MDRSFIQHYQATVLKHLNNDHRDNFDARRFGTEKVKARSFRATLSHNADMTLGRMGLARMKRVKHYAGLGFGLKTGWLEGLSWLYDHLSDQASKDLLVEVIAFRALGHRFVKLPNNNAEHWARIERLEQAEKGASTVAAGHKDMSLCEHDMSSLGFPIKLFAKPVGLASLFQLEQYRYPSQNGAVAVAAGDVVIDAGGCWGDSALYFAHLAGPAGRVVSFEFMPSNLEVFERNMALNPELAGRITLARNPIWSVSDADLFVSGSGPGTSVSPTPKQPNAVAVKTLTIDDMLARTGVPRVDFIKMDIEGAEMHALHGASATIKQFKPKLAICVYHDLSDFWTVPQFVQSLGLDYEFFFGHYTTHAEESVVFGRPRVQA